MYLTANPRLQRSPQDGWIAYVCSFVLPCKWTSYCFETTASVLGDLICHYKFIKQIGQWRYSWCEWMMQRFDRPLVDIFYHCMTMIYRKWQNTTATMFFFPKNNDFISCCRIVVSLKGWRERSHPLYFHFSKCICVANVNSRVFRYCIHTIQNFILLNSLISKCWRAQWSHLVSKSRSL